MVKSLPQKRSMHKAKIKPPHRMQYHPQMRLTIMGSEDPDLDADSSGQLLEA